MNGRPALPGRKPAFLGWPRTRAGWWSIGLAFGFFPLFAAWLAYVRATPRPRPTFFSDPVHAAILLASVASAVCGLIIGLITLARGRERSLAILPALLIGLIVLLLTFAESGALDQITARAH
jgi:hypothetical protein